MIRLHIELAQELSRRIDADPRLQRVASTPFALVSFRHLGGNDATDRLAASINASGEAYLTPSKLGDQSFIRVSIGQTQTEKRHVDRLWQRIDQLA
jgi:aromatic-L-amino-acid decarboxylase